MSQNPIAAVPNPLPSQSTAPPPIIISTRAKFLHQILVKTPEKELETKLASAQIEPTQEIVHEVLKLSYGSPAAAIKFFRWAGLTHKHDEHSWNLMVDLLGKNQLFEKMWDAIRSMKQEGVLTLDTFVSCFGNYCVAGKVGEAIMTFDVMERYEVEPNTFAVNSLLSAICRGDNQTKKAAEFFEKVKGKVPPDGDTFAILLEGWEKQGNVSKAKSTFGEMVIRVGWKPEYMPAYDAFLTTLVRGSNVDEAINFLLVMKGKNCLPGMKFFSSALDILVKQNKPVQAIQLWDTMVGSGLIPNLVMYNSLIGLLCNNRDDDNAIRFLDEMVYHGAFPDSSTYNMIFQCLVKQTNIRKVSKFFAEMVKNEWPPTSSNCAEAITVLFDGDDPEAAIEIWNYMANNHISPLDEAANALLIGLCNLSRLTELKKYAYEMLDHRIKIKSSTMEKLKSSFSKEGRDARDTYDHLERKWKSAKTHMR